MKIPKALIEKWTKLKSHGDGKKLVAAAGSGSTINDADISRAFSKGECRDDVFVLMAEFYRKKEEMINGYLQETGDQRY